MWNSVFSQPLPNLGGFATGAAPSSDPIGGLAPSTTLHTGTASTTTTIAPSQTSSGYYSTVQWNTTPGGPPPMDNARTTATERKITIEDIIHEHEQELLTKTQTEMDEKTSSRTQDALKNQINQVWEHDRKVWLEGIIGFRPIGTTAAQAITAGPSTGASAGALIPYSSLTTSTESIDWSQTQPVILSGVSQDGSLDRPFADDHWNIIKTGGYPPNALETAKNLKRLVTSKTSGQWCPPVLSGYYTALDWVITLLELNVSSSKLSQAAGTIVHLCRQFESLMKARVQQAIQLGHEVEPLGLQEDGSRRCYLFAKITLGNPSHWSVLFYCLRIGDAKAAFEIWSRMGDVPLTDAQRSAIDRILSGMNQLNSKRLWESEFPILSIEDRKVVAEMLNGAADIHQSGVLALLSGLHDLPISEEAELPGFSSIEDYLFGRLWTAMMDNKPIEKVQKFGNHILELGASYFSDKDDESGGWSFALPLLVSQQYARAFVHLAHSGENTLMQAVHLALVAEMGGIPISDISDTTPNRQLVVDLVAAYVSKLPGTQVDVDYLARIPDRDRAQKKIAALIATTGDVASFAGSINAEGVRQKGLLDKYMNPDEIGQVLYDAAGRCMRARHSSQKVRTAALCYLSGGFYNRVIGILIDMISPPESPDETRKQWLELTKEFDRIYIQPGGRVYNKLEREGNLDLIEVYSNLIMLNEFFELLKARRFPEAWQVLNRTGLLPLSQPDRDRLYNVYQGKMDDKIRNSYPALLTGAMQILVHDFESAKKAGGPQASEVVTAQLTHLKSQANSITMFAGLIGASGSLSSMQSLMV